MTDPGAATVARMGWFLVMVRRSLWLLLVSAIGGAAYAYWRDRKLVEPAGPPEWPPEWPPLAAPTPTSTPTPPAAVVAADASPTERPANIPGQVGRIDR